MKKFYLLFIILLSANFCFGQKLGDGKTNWSVPSQSPCFPNLFFSYRSQGYVPSVSGYSFNWRIENRSSKKVSFTIGPWLYAADKQYKEKMLDGLFTLDPGETYTHTTGYNKILPEGSSVEFTIDNYSDEKGGPEYSCGPNGKYIKNKGANQSKIDDEKKKKYDGLISQGDLAFKNKNYDSAMNYYTQASNTAVDDQAKSQAIQKYNQAYEAKRNAARETRVAQAKQDDRAEDLNYAAGAGVVAGSWALMRDGYTHKSSSAKFQAGVGYGQTPMYTNQTNSYAAAASYEDKAAYPMFDFGLKLEFLNNSPVNFNVRGLFSTGLHALETGVSGVHTVAGVDGGLQLWYKTATKFKLFADFGWYDRTGERKRDQDAVNGGATATDNVRTGKYRYKVLRMGFGPMLHLRDSGKESWVKPGVYFDQFSFAKNDKPKMIFGINVYANSSLMFEGMYGKNYPVAGTIDYPNSFNPAKQDYFYIKISKQGKLW